MDYQLFKPGRGVRLGVLVVLCLVVWFGFTQRTPLSDRPEEAERQLRETVASVVLGMGVPLVVHAIQRRRLALAALTLGGGLAFGVLALTILPAALVAMLTGWMTPLLVFGLLFVVGRWLAEHLSIGGSAS
jgi:hypothetical protein